MNQDKFIDLHIHSNYSDGLLSPKEIVNYAAKYNLAAIAIADHDITSGIPEASEEGKKLNIEIVPAVELSAEMVPILEDSDVLDPETQTRRSRMESNQRIENLPTPQVSSYSKEMHILGYFIDWTDNSLEEKLHFFREKRKERAYSIYEKLTKLGIKLNSQILEEIGRENHSFGRLNFARALVKEGYVHSISEAFKLYLDYGQPAYVKKALFKPKEAIELILQTGGIPILAHPYFITNPTIISTLVSFGLKGIEVWHRKHSSSSTQKLVSLAKKEGLLMTGGSDFHGETDTEKPFIGSLRIPYTILEELKQCLPLVTTPQVIT